jgi:hypothetical protein
VLQGRSGTRGHACEKITILYSNSEPVVARAHIGRLPSPAHSTTRRCAVRSSAFVYSTWGWTTGAVDLQGGCLGSPALAALATHSSRPRRSPALTLPVCARRHALARSRSCYFHDSSHRGTRALTPLWSAACRPPPPIPLSSSSTPTLSIP